MLATLTDAPPERLLENPRVIYEPKYDGIRALVSVEPAHPSARVAFWSRLGNEKTAQFPELVKALKDFGAGIRRPVVLDGEIVALDARGVPAGFQELQPRMHVQDAREIARLTASRPVAFIAFDVLRDGADDLRSLPLTARRARLTRIFGTRASSTVRLGPFAAGSGKRLYDQAANNGWEGLVAKDAASPYQTGRRSPAWRKIKIVRRQEFVVGGWTEPRSSRQYFGALLLGVYGDEAPKRLETGGSRRPHGRRQRPSLVFVGQAGSGFTDAELVRVWKLLGPMATPECPFTAEPTLAERGRWSRPEPVHWVRPELVAEVKFSEWTSDGKLRHPVFLGLRTDVDPLTVRREIGTFSRNEAVDDLGTSAAPRRAATASRKSGMARTSSKRAAPKTRTAGKRLRPAGARKPAVAPSPCPPGSPLHAALEAIVDRLDELQQARKDGEIALPDGSILSVTNLRKVFWPELGVTKGDLLRFYVRVSPWILPGVADRPLVMKRFPNGVAAKAFYQQRAPDEVPPGVRVEVVGEGEPESGGANKGKTGRRSRGSGDDEGPRPMLVGGNLLTLLYMTQLAAISQDPWFSRVSSPLDADYVAIDLDPMPGVSFDQLLDVARWVHDELSAVDVFGLPKTSGSAGVHIYVPLAPGTSYQSGQLLCQIVATIVATKHPKHATVERKVGARGRTVYVDYLQNIPGKTLATAYSVRASDYAGVSTPLTWEEVHAGVDPRDFTIATAVERFRSTGDLWARVRNPEHAVDLRSVLQHFGE